MNFGLNLLLFGDKIGPRVLRQFPKLAEIGFDGVEVPIFEPRSIAIDRIRRCAEDNVLGITASGALPQGSRFYGPDAAGRKLAEQYVRDAVRVVSELGGTVFCGPLYKPVGDTDDSVAPAIQHRETAKALASLADEAAALGVTLALEPLNRFETDFLNTVEQGIQFCTSINSKGVGLLLDTFHMHIEEKNTPAAIRRAAKAGFLVHFHASENDRGIAGSGQVRWKRVAAALRKAKYDGWVVLESFSQSNVAIRKAVSCWRPFYESSDAFAEQGLKFIKRLLSTG